MRILWLSAGLLLPLDKGGKLRTWHLLRHLARGHHVEYLSYADPAQPAADLDGMHEVCAVLHTVPLRPIEKGTVAFAADALGHLVRRLPYAVGRYATEDYGSRVRTLLERGTFDLIVSDFLPPMANLPARLPAPLVLFTHNVEAAIWQRHVETATSPIKRALLATQWRRMVRFERDAVRRADLVLAVSDADRQTLESDYGPLRAPVAVVPTGVDTSYFEPGIATVDPRHLVFTGSMDWLPNEDGMLFFVREVLPLIRQEEPTATLAIVGRSPTPAVQRLAEVPGVAVTGRVEDIRPHVAQGAVYVVPLRIGGGTRLKIFEAMAMGKAIVSTTIGAEGLPVTSGLDIQLADDPVPFAHAVVRLLRNQTERARLGDAARHLVQQHYDWTAVSGYLERALVAAARRQDAPRPATASLRELEASTRESR